MKTSRIILGLLASVLPMWMNAQTIVLDEGFESGAIPSTWSQEYGPRDSKVVADDCPWKVEKGGVKPTGAAQGQYRAYFRNETGQTQGYVSRLVLPEMHLASVYEPILRFSYAQTRWRTDIDTLRVLYKAKALDKWHVLQEYTASQPLWKRVELHLPGVTNTYQIAFEGSDGLGYGIVLDSIQVRSMPQCTTPHDLLVSEVSGGEATLSWNADYDAAHFRIMVDGKQTYTTTDDAWNYRLTGLSTGEHTASVQALCEAEESDWSDTITFLIPVEMPLPYFYDFNDCPKSTVAWWPEGWNFGNNAGMNAFVSNHSDNNNERTSPDKSPSLIFALDNFYIRSIPAGNYQYAVTPALSGAPLNTCRVRFSAGVYEFNGANYAHSIIVGVMTDAMDVTTFVPVDTVSVMLYEKFQTCNVELSSYQGNGRFVAFMSDFDKPNNFFIDNVYIKPHDEKDAPVNVHAIGHTDEMAIRWEGLSSQYGVQIHSDEIEVVLQGLEGDSIVPFDTIITGITATNTLVTNLREWTRYTVRVWAQNGDTSEWTTARTSVPYTIPLTYNFNGGPYDTTTIVNSFYAPKGVQTFGTNNFRPYCGSSNSSFTVYGRTGKGFGLTESTIGKMGSHDYWAVYPYMERMDTLQMLFYMNCGDSRKAGNAWLSVGVMEDPQDLSTYREMLQCVGTENWQRYVLDLAESPMQNGFVAMHWYSPDATMGSNAWVDDVNFDRRGECDMVKDIRVDEAQLKYNQALLLFTAPEGATVKVRVSTNQDLSDAQLAAGSSCAFKSDNAKGGSVLATNLEGGITYYIYMQALCPNTTTSLWSSPVAFTTPCAPLTLPYTDGFENWGTGYKYRPTCWNGVSTTSSSPQTVSGTTLAHTGSKYLTLSSNYAGDTTSVVTPAIEEGIANIRLRFYARSYSAGDKLYIGVLSDPEDYSTYEPLAKAVSKGKEYTLYEFTFVDYKGTGKYLSIMTTNADTVSNSVTWFMDDLEIVSLECLTPFDVRFDEISSTSIQTSWSGTSSQGWQVVVADAKIDPNNLEAEKSHIVVNTTVSVSTYKATDLQSQTIYYIYIRTLCPDAEWVETSKMTECRSLVLNKVYDLENQTGYANTTNIPESAHIECWTMMNSGANQRTSASVPYVYQSTGAAYSGKNCIYLMAPDYDHASWFALPAAEVEDMTMLIVRFYAKHDYKYNWYDVEVGVMDDPTVDSTFTLVGKISPTNSKTQYKLTLEDYKGNGRYIAFRSTSASCPIFIDDIEITEALCKNIHPTVSNITSNSVLVKSNLTTKDAWIVRLSSVEGFVKDTVITIPRFATVHGLPDATLLTLSAASICSIEGTDTIFGDWEELTFLTRCVDVNVDETSLEDFEDMKPRLNSSDPYYDIPCWQVGNNTSGSTQVPYVISKESMLPTEYLAKNENSFYSGDQCLVFYTGRTSDAAWAAMPQLSANDPITNVQLTFWARGTESFSSNKLIVGITTDLTDWASFEPIDTIYTDIKEYNKYMVRFNGYKGDYLGHMGRYITFASQFGADNLIYIDDIELKHIPTCAEPIDVEAQEIGDQQATITWQGVSDRYRVMVTDTVLTEDAWEDYTQYLSNDTITTTSYILHMPQLGRYYVYVKGLCGDMAGAWNVKGVEVTPLCGARLTVPAIESFEESEDLPVCWKPIGTTYYNSVKVGIDSVRTGSRSLQMHNYFYSNKTATGIVLPLLSEEPGDCKISFWINKGKQTSNTIYAALLADRDSITVDSLANIPALYQQTVIGNTWQSVSFDFSKLEPEQVADKSFIVLYTKTSNNNYNLYLDDIQIVKMPTCRAPRKIEALMTTGTDASVTIKPFRSYNTEWEIEVMDTLTKTQTITQTQTLTTTISGLLTDRTYALSARTVCGPEEKSEWGDTIYLHTVVTPTGLTAVATDETVTLTWDDQAHGHWNLYISKEFILPSEVPDVPEDTFIVVEKNITVTSYVFQAEENTKYYFLLQSANMGSSKDTYTYTSATTLKHVYEPENVQITSLSDTSVTIQWEDQTVISNKIEISTDAEFTNIVMSTTVSGVQTYTYGQLEEQTTYYIRISQVKGVYQSEWVNTSFTTLCALAAVPFEYGFEETALPTCWTTVSNRSGYPKANTSAGYHSEGSQSWDFYATSAAQCPQTIVLPGLDAQLNECVLRFKARCHNAAGTNYGDATMYVALASDPQKLSVENIYSQSVVDSVKVSGKTFIEYEVDMTTLSAATVAGKHYILIYLKDKGRVYMDELIVKESDACRKPMQLRSITTTGTTATLTFDQAKPAGKWFYAVCSDAAMTDTLQQDTIHAQTFVITGLQKSTTYYARVRQICDEDNMSDASETASFTTLLAPYYEEKFHTDTIPGDWTKASGWVDSICAGQPFTDYSNTWRILTTGIAISGNHAFYRAYSTWHNDWLISPAISLDMSDSTLLSFDAALTMHDNQLPVADSQGLRFLALISKDAGQTWNAADTMRITELSNSSKRYAMDLTAYRGYVIRVAFYVEITVDKIADMDIHLGNVRINWYHTDETEVTACEFEDIIFEEEGIVIAGGTYPVGDHSVNTLIPAADPEGGKVNDIVRRLTAHILPSPSAELSDTTCEGEPYSEYGFTNLKHSGIFKRKLQAANGCDSLVVLHLTVNPLKYEYITDTYEPGTTYEKYGFKATEPGEYSHTNPSLLTGCDSTTVLYLMPATGWLEIAEESNEDVTKILENEEVIIIRNGRRYSLLGEER